MLSAESWYPMESRKLTNRMVVESKGMSINNSQEIRHQAEFDSSNEFFGHFDFWMCLGPLKWHSQTPKGNCSFQIRGIRNDRYTSSAMPTMAAANATHLVMVHGLGPTGATSCQLDHRSNPWVYCQNQFSYWQNNGGRPDPQCSATKRIDSASRLKELLRLEIWRASLSAWHNQRSYASYFSATKKHAFTCHLSYVHPPVH